MIGEKEIQMIKKYLGSDGKLIISDELTDKQKERFEFINTLDVDLMGIISRGSNYQESVDDDSEEDSDDNENDYQEDDIETLESSDSISTNDIEENNESVNDLDDFF